jgi:hypothetical protein
VLHDAPFDRDAEDAATSLRERRWFAAFKAASEVRAECETLLESMAHTQLAWNLARARLAELETLRDTLEEELSDSDERKELTAA